MNARHGLITAPLILGALFLWLLQGCATADTLTGRVINITDGDTLTILNSSFQQHQIRLTGIDAPESEQPFGTVSRQQLAGLVFGKQVTVQYDEQDRYGRTLGKVLVNGQDVNLKQVQDGLAWYYKYYQSDQAPVDRVAYSMAEIQARQARLGLWAEAHPIPPWDWRRGERAVTENASSVTTAGACSSRRACAELAACDAVMRYVRQCGFRGLDGDGDRVSCESLCR